ncbi:MAG: TlpA family protein disulfide reductase [Fimbriimonadales bacterium]
MKIRIIAVAMLAALAGAAFAGDSAEEMLAKVKAVSTPKFDPAKRGDNAYMQQYYADVNKANEERNKLILDFYKTYPDNEEADKLLVQRWSTMGGAGRRLTKDTIAPILADIDSILSANPPTQVKQDGTFWKARYGVVAANNDIQEANKAIDGFTKAYPADPRGAQLLSMESQFPAAQSDKAVRRAIYARMAADYKDSPSAKYAPGILRQMDSVGKPFDLTFTDAISGKQISMKDLRGKVVLLDFWATWCGPCIAKMPDMKQLYADLHSKGFEVLGISLDHPEAKGGLTKLKDYVAKNDIAWPQYYQGNYWQSEFSTSWGINSIPCVFLIDKNGNLAEVTYPEDLPNKVKKLLGN